jgi:hypothetical protein
VPVRQSALHPSDIARDAHAIRPLARALVRDPVSLVVDYPGLPAPRPPALEAGDTAVRVRFGE